MRRTLIAALILAAAGAIALRAGAADVLIPRDGKPSPDAAPRAIEFRVLDRGNTRMVWIANTVNQGAVLGGSRNFGTPEEIDVTGATLYVETDTVASFVGTVGIASADGQGSLPVYPMQFAYGGHSIQHLTFDPPVRLRAGDYVFYESGTAPSFTRVEISLHGYVPGAVRENGIMAR